MTLKVIKFVTSEIIIKEIRSLGQGLGTKLLVTGARRRLDAQISRFPFSLPVSDREELCNYRT